MPTFQRAWGVIAFILVIHVLALFTGWYESHQWFDVPMHFSGGFGIALFALASWNAIVQKITFQKQLKPYLEMVFYALAIIGFVALVGVVWEWYEFIFDHIAMYLSSNIQPAQMGLGDTMADLFLDVLGASLAFVLFRNRRLK